VSERIALRGIRAFGKHGVFDVEKAVPQPFDVDVELDARVSAARTSDRLADTLDYAALHARVLRIVRGESFTLIERLADAIGAALLEDERVERVRVTVAKPHLLAGATPSVTIESKRGPSDA
jgi:dihydroneopterin aldolase